MGVILLDRGDQGLSNGMLSVCIYLYFRETYDDIVFGSESKLWV